MDRKEAMTLSGGSASYYLHRGGISGSGSGSQLGEFNNTPGFRPLLNTNISSQHNIRESDVASTFSVEPSHSNFPYGSRMIVPSSVPSSEPVKKKRGRPRKYGPNGPVSLGLSPVSSDAKPGSGEPGSPTPKRNRGRPRGSGRKQQLATFGEWVNSSAGLAFAPHVIIIEVGEDIVAKLFSFAQQRPRALCILSGSGTVSSVSLRQPASTGVSVTYEGRFQILCLSGSYLVAEGSPRNRTGGISVSLSSPDGHVIGGAAAMLMAASPIQVVVCSFVYGGKAKTKQITAPKSEENSEPHGEKLTIRSSAPLTQSYTPTGANAWLGSAPADMRNLHTGIDLTRG